MQRWIGLVLASLTFWVAMTAGPPLVTAQSGEAPAQARRACFLADLGQPPGWTISSSWSTDGTKLLVVDSLYNRILRFSETGRAHGDLPEAVGDQLANFFPSVIKPYRSNLLVELANGRMVTLSSDLLPVKKKNVLVEGFQGGVKIESMFQWDVAGDDLITYSDLKGPGENEWRTAFLRVPLDNPSAFTILKPLPPASMRTLMRLGQPYIATIGNTAFTLMAEGTMRIYRNEKGKADWEPLNSLPPGSDLTPDLPTFRQPNDFADVMKAVERSSMPVGLYGWESFLYVVSRSPGASGTRWTLTRIDPRTDEVVGTAIIPVQANHLVVAPGPRSWAFLAKASVESLGVQNTRGIFFVPSERIRGPLQGDLCN